jgi:hypothetical protein
MDYTFRLDHELDREFEHELSARDIILATLTDALLETTCMVRSDCELMAEQLFSRIEPYICYEGK